MVTVQAKQVNGQDGWSSYLVSTQKKFSVFSKKHPGFYSWIRILPVFCLFFALAWYKLDPDFGWHLEAGNYIRQHWLPAHDLFTYTARNYSWIDHEWGNDVLLSLLYHYGGYLILAVFYSSLWTAALFINGRQKLWLLLLAALALLPYIGVRPDVWTALGLALLLRITSGKSRFPKAAIPFIFIIWANLHGGFVIGLAYLAYLALARRSKTWGLVFLFSIFATFLNAYGPRLYVEVARTLFDRSLHSQIGEWEPFYILMPSWPYIISWLCGFWLFSRKKLGNWFRFDTLLIVAGFSSSRNIALFVIASLAATEAYIQQAVAMIPRRLDPPRRLVLGILTGMAVVSIFYGLKDTYWPLTPRESVYPVQAVAYLQEHPCTGNLFNDYNYGGYLIWKLPSEPVYIDGRMPSWRDPAGVKYIDTYLQVLSDKQVRSQQFRRYNIGCVLLKRTAQNQPMIGQLEKSHWGIVSEANSAILLIKPQTN